jgi:hypothetical protein
LSFFFLFFVVFFLVVKILFSPTITKWVAIQINTYIVLFFIYRLWKSLLKQFVLLKILYAYLVILKAVYILVHNRPLCTNSSISGEKIHVYKSHKIRTLDIS